MFRCFVGYLLCFCVSVCVPVVLLVFVVLLCERVCSGCFVGYLLCFCVSVVCASCCCFVGYLLCFCVSVCSGSFVGYLLCFCVVSVYVPVVLLGICCASV